MSETDQALVHQCRVIADGLDPVQPALSIVLMAQQTLRKAAKRIEELTHTPEKDPQ